MAANETIAAFLDGLASSAPTPGGGGAAAISGAMGAALVSMVCNLTIGKKKYVEVEGELKEILGQSEALRAELTGMIEAKMGYEANLAVMETGMDMWDMLMSALEPKDRDERWG